MKKFLLRICLPVFLLVSISLAVLEIALRQWPDEHRTKANWMNENAAGLKVLVLGSSSTNRGVRPSLLELQPAYSCAGMAQDLQNDYFILKKYIDRMDSLKFVILDINYLTLFHSIDGLDRYKTLRNSYFLYYGNDRYKTNFIDRFEISWFGLEGLASKLQYNKEEVREDGWVYSPNPGYTHEQLEKQGIGLSAEQTVIHGKEDSLYIQNVGYLNDIVSLCSAHNVSVLIVSCPVHESFYSRFDDEQVAAINNAISGVLKSSDNVIYLNCFQNELFTDEDFINANHLNSAGAEKLSLLINNAIMGKE